MIIGLQVLSALCVFSISFSAPCFGNQKQFTSLPDDSMQLLCTNPEPIGVARGGTRGARAPQLKYHQ